MMTNSAPFTVTWEKLPDDYRLPDDPVDNITQPCLAAALTDSLNLAGKLPENSITFTNYGICATVNGKIVVKAPDWGFVPTVRVSRQEVNRSYTPQLQGDIPAIVMEFLSETEGTEYSSKPTYPPGKWFFYEQVLKVPNYVIFEPETAALELYRFDETGRYKLQPPAENQRVWIPEINLFLGVWQGTRENRSGYWLRWWDADGQLLLWNTEVAEQERQRTALERQRAEEERQRADRLAEKLRELGINPEQL